QPVPRPDVAPGGARDEVLEGGGEGVLAGDRRVDVGPTEDLAADLHAPPVPLTVGQVVAHERAPAVAVTWSGRAAVRCSSSSAVTAPGCSRPARWEAGSRVTSSDPG